MRAVIGHVGRLVFWLSLVYIVGLSLVTSYRAGDYGAVVLKAIFFPLTYLIWPWFAGVWWALLLGLLGYWLSTFVGRLEPID